VEHICSDSKTVGRKSDRGAILILSALIMILMLLIAAFATDLGAWYRQGQEQQRSADVASLNGIQAYDSFRKAYFVTNGASIWTDLDDDQREEAEEGAMEAAMDAMLGILSAGGTTVSQTPEYVFNPPPGESTATVTADDGSIITVTRTIEGEMQVSIERPGKQYFSSVVASAPNIAKSSTAVLSNCGAECSQDIELAPPFQGFQATGEGDGYRPLIGNNGRIWTINHHADRPGDGDIVCMQRSTQAECSGWAPLDLSPYTTARKSDDWIDNSRDRIYFAGTDRNTDEFGIVCVDANIRQFCGGGAEFTKLHDSNLSQGGNYNYATGSGVFMVRSGGVDRLFVMGQDATIHCVYADSLGSPGANCAGYPKQTALFGHENIPSLSQDSYMVYGEIINGQIYFYHDKTRDEGGAFQCWNPATDSQCVWANGSGYTEFNQPITVRPIKFVKYKSDGSGEANGFCIAQEADASQSLQHWCVDLQGVSQPEIPNLRYNTADFGGSGDYIYSEGFSIDGKRTVWGTRGGDSRFIFCYDWAAEASCGPPLVGEQQYGFAELTPDCILGVGHSSELFSFNPNTMTPCTGTKVTVDVWPCDCLDGTFRYGTLELPAALKAVLISAEATVTGVTDENVTVTEGPIDILNQPFDLSGFNGIDGPLSLEIVVDSEVDEGTGQLLWTTTYDAQLALIVQPTLSD